MDLKDFFVKTSFDKVKTKPFIFLAVLRRSL